MEEIIRNYFDAWLQGNVQPIKDIFSENIVYSECYGPEYHGLSQLVRWFEDWNKRGTVLVWKIKRVIEHRKTVVVEWYFECEYDGKIDGFDGITIADFDREDKIEKLCEFQSKAEHYYPYG